MTTYTRITLTDKKRLTLQVINETAEWLLGWAVDRDGDRTDEQHLIDKTAIATRQAMKMNLHYGTLERA